MARLQLEKLKITSPYPKKTDKGNSVVIVEKMGNLNEKGNFRITKINFKKVIQKMTNFSFCVN